jgi:hypothetical protein
VVLLARTRPGQLRLDRYSLTNAGHEARLIDVSDDCPLEGKGLRAWVLEAAGSRTSSEAAASLPFDAEPPSRRHAHPTVAEPAPDLPPSARFALEVDLMLLSRSFGYVSPETSNLLGYQLDLAPVPAIRGALAPFSEGSMRELRIAGFYRHSLGLGSELSSGGTRFPSTFSDLEISLGYRWIPPRSIAHLALVPMVAYRATTFSVSSASSTSRPADLPNVSYGGPRFALAAQIPIQRSIELDLGVGYQLLQGAGDLTASFFPGASGYGLDIGAGVLVDLIAGLRGRLEASFTHFSLDFGTPTGPRIAKGSADDFLGVSFGVLYQHD